jgi:radical SAM superfamily enzyme YgiQ (UPF0313 family)
MFTETEFNPDAPSLGVIREAIHKLTTNEEIEGALDRAERAGLQTVKLYFMIGLPTEEEDDVRALPEFVARLRERHSRLAFSVGVSPFVPKPLTPFATEALRPIADLERRLALVREGLRRCPGVSLTSEGARWSYVQGVLSRGGAELGPVLIEAARRGGRFGDFRAALRAAGLALEDYALPRPDDEGRYPWEIVSGHEVCS